MDVHSLDSRGRSALTSNDDAYLGRESLLPRRGVKRSAEERLHDQDIVLLSPTLGPGGLSNIQANELAEIMMELALNRSGKTAMTDTGTGHRDERLGAESASSTLVPRSVGATSSVRLLCTICNRFLHQPVTAGCGHTFCLRCISSARSANASRETSTSSVCAVSGCDHTVTTDNLHVNIPLAELLRKWFPSRAEFVEKWRDGERFLVESKLEEAVRALTDALRIGKCRSLNVFFITSLVQ